MIREIKYFIFIIFIFTFIFFSFNFYISEENKKKTFRKLSTLDKNIDNYKSDIPILVNDTEQIVKYLNNEDNSNSKKFSFWELLKNEN